MTACKLFSEGANSDLAFSIFYFYLLFSIFYFLFSIGYRLFSIVYCLLAICSGHAKEIEILHTAVPAATGHEPSLTFAPSFLFAFRSAFAKLPR
jgi:hypothetical protein